MNANNDDQNPDEKPAELSNSIANASIVLLVAATVCVSAPLTGLAALTLAASGIVRWFEKQ